MNFKDKVGTFRVIRSFTIRKKKEFYLIGELLEGSLIENNYINIVLNSSLAISARISSTEDIEMANDPKIYQLIIIESSEEEMNDILFCQNVADENVYITLSGED
ncbi:hypothetical protein B0A69_05530 [Chryseobacterium shigense]|uniref:Uncharacterized protein n=1 Tax=Chryseobacterium shigense TaxID=297244 RepID=A0A1N7IKX6_9FLAO|nr:hypothetical protein [Chryseobacterium shigense]PQA95831.1 hypothetical protein B0A69_05530 [Chryseobacterium shigense]SIS37754.1 hypothetical protein SAMN05421639_104158 [Chryseobacterium shigense]